MAEASGPTYLERLKGIRYVVPLREGGSLPAVVQASNGGAYVVKFFGAGQGPRALIAEALGAGIGRMLGLPVPHPAVVQLDPGFGAAEPDQEIQDVLRASVGENFGLAFLSGALPYDPAADCLVDPALAANVVWLDAYLTNVDRTVRNTNLLMWEGGLWLIDHGASLYVHHRWEGWQERIQSRFPQIKQHVLLPLASSLRAADERLRPLLPEDALRALVADVPDAWLGEEPGFADRTALRDAYVTYLCERLNGPREWLQEAIEAQKRGPVRLSPRLTHRVV